MPFLTLAVQLLTGCAWILGEPVPPHGTLESTLDSVIDKRVDGVEAWLLPSDQVVTSLADRWEMSRESAEILKGAKKPSEIARAFGSLAPTCTNCHRGDATELTGSGHGDGFRLLLEGMRVDDAGVRHTAYEMVASAPDLGNSYKRIRQLTERLADDDDPIQQSRALRSLISECWRCHADMN